MRNRDIGPRGLAIVDGLILTAGIALGLAIVRGLHPLFMRSDFWAWLAHPREG